jgi:hypothetical protein
LGVPNGASTSYQRKGDGQSRHCLGEHGQTPDERQQTYSAPCSFFDVAIKHYLRNAFLHALAARNGIVKRCRLCLGQDTQFLGKQSLRNFILA